MAAGRNAGGERESGLEARLSSWSREYEMRGVPPGVVPYTLLVDAPVELTPLVVARMGIVDDIIAEGSRKWGKVEGVRGKV